MIGSRDLNWGNNLFLFIILNKIGNISLMSKRNEYLKYLNLYKRTAYPYLQYPWVKYNNYIFTSLRRCWCFIFFSISDLQASS